MDHQAAVVGRAVSRFRETAAPDLGVIDNSSQGKELLALSSLRRDLDGRPVKAGRAFRRHRLEVSGRRGKVAHVFVPRSSVIGNRDGGRLRGTEVISSRFNNSAHPDNADGVRGQLISCPRALPARRHPVAVGAMFVDTQGVTRTSIGKVLSCPRRNQPGGVFFVAN